MVASAFFDPAVHFDVAGKIVVDLGALDTEFAHEMLRRQASRVFVVSNKELEAARNIQAVRARPWEFYVENIDIAFLDSRLIDDFDYVYDLQRLASALERILAPNGQAFVVLRTGLTQADWDVFNSVSITPLGAMPTSPLLFDTIMADMAVRPLKRLPSPSPGHAIDRIFRISRKKPNLLIILGHSQSGKTTLARDLREREKHAHVSSDYVFSELVRMKASGAKLDENLAELINGGTFENAGEFFRGLESSEDRLKSYLTLVVRLLPPNKRLISVDLDLRKMEMLDFVKSFFSEAGYSTWAVTR